MTKAKTPLKLVPFDAARYLDDDEAIAEYMTAVLEANDPDLLLLFSLLTFAFCISAFLFLLLPFFIFSRFTTNG